MQVVKTSSFTGTWLSRKGTVHTFNFDKSRFGKRVCFHVWADTPNMMDVSVLKGTFWRGDGTERMFFESKDEEHSDAMQSIAEQFALCFFKD